jgi:hypothetical protein
VEPPRAVVEEASARSQAGRQRHVGLVAGCGALWEVLPQGKPCLVEEALTESRTMQKEASVPAERLLDRA